MSYVTSKRNDRFIRLRKWDRGKKPGSLVTAATINKDRCHIRPALRKAKRWGYLKEVPERFMLMELKRRKNFVAEDHFTMIYQACDVARLPVDPPYSAGQWRRRLLTFAYMTGGRIGELPSLVWDDVSLDHGYAFTQAKDNKGGRDESIYLHPLVVDHLRMLWTPHESLVFPWEKSRRPLDTEFSAIQTKAGIKSPASSSGATSARPLPSILVPR